MFLRNGRSSGSSEVSRCFPILISRRKIGPSSPDFSTQGRASCVAEGSPALCAWEKPVCADDINSLVPILCLHLSHDAVNMVFNGELGKVQVGGDLFRSETLRNESGKFALPVSESKLDAVLSR